MLTSVAQAASALPPPLQCGQISSCVLGNSLFLLTSNPSTGRFFVLGNNNPFIVANARLGHYRHYRIILVPSSISFSLGGSFSLVFN